LQWTTQSALVLLRWAFKLIAATAQSINASIVATRWDGGSPPRATPGRPSTTAPSCHRSVSAGCELRISSSAPAGCLNPYVTPETRSGFVAEEIRRERASQTTICAVTAHIASYEL
jgi:hypothetical protein